MEIDALDEIESESLESPNLLNPIIPIDLNFVQNFAITIAKTKYQSNIPFNAANSLSTYLL